MKIKNKKLSLVFLVVMLVTIGTITAIYVGYRQISTAPELLLSSIQEGADLSLGKIRQTATRDGKKEWSLEAGSALYIDNDKKAVLADLFITYYLKDNREVYLEADKGILQTDTNDIELSGNVVVRNDEYRLKTSRLNYENAPRVIFTNEPVQITGKDVELTANSLKYDLNKDQINLNGDVEAIVSTGMAGIQALGER